MKNYSIFFILIWFDIFIYRVIHNNSLSKFHRYKDNNRNLRNSIKKHRKGSKRILKMKKKIIKLKKIIRKLKNKLYKKRNLHKKRKLKRISTKLNDVNHKDNISGERKLRNIDYYNFRL